MLLSLSSPDGSVTDTTCARYAEFDLRNRLLAVPGVAQVVAIGGELPEYQVNVQPDQLLLYGLTVKDVVEAAREAHSTASAGYLPNVGGLELPMRQTARVRSRRGHQGHGRQVPRRRRGHDRPGRRRGARPAPRSAAPAAEGGRPAVVLSVQKSPGTNTLADHARDRPRARPGRGGDARRA